MRGLLCYLYKAEVLAVKPWAERFYSSEAWHACRDGFMRSKGFLCERCSLPDDPVFAKIAHHKTHLTRDNINDPYLSLSWDNLEALCQDCHNKEHHKSKKKKRYSFDASGNLIPPMQQTSKEITTPRRAYIIIPHVGTHDGCTR